MNRLRKLSLSRSAALCAVSLIGTGGAFAQSACLSVQQNGEKVSIVGSAWHTLGNGKQLTIECANGKVNVSNGTNVVATLPCANSGALVVEVGQPSEENTLSCGVSYKGYATLYSPFQLAVPDSSKVEVFAPTYEDGKLVLSKSTRLAPGTVIAPETGLILKNEGTIDFAFSNAAATCTGSALSGTSLNIATPTVSGQTIYTLGQATEDASLFGFFRYVGTALPAGKAYYVSTQTGSSERVLFNFNDSAAGITDATVDGTPLTDGKRIENGQVVIVKNGHKYNVSGNRVR